MSIEPKRFPQTQIHTTMSAPIGERKAGICATCGGTGTFTYTWSISAKSKGTATVRCLACQKKPDDPYKFAS